MPNVVVVGNKSKGTARGVGTGGIYKSPVGAFDGLECILTVHPSPGGMQIVAKAYGNWRKIPEGQIQYLLPTV